MEDEKTLLAVEIQKIEVELNQLTDNLEKANEGEKEELEGHKAALEADLVAKKSRIDELEQEPPPDAPPAVSSEPVLTEQPAAEPPPADADEGAPNESEVPDVPVLVEEIEPKVDAPKPKTAPSAQKSEPGSITREQMMKILQGEKTRLVQSAQSDRSKVNNEDMETWLATLKSLQREGIINESDVHVDKVEEKIKLLPAGDNKIQQEIQDIEEIIILEEENEFRIEFEKWLKKHPSVIAAGTEGTAQKPPVVKANAPIPDSNVLAKLKDAEARAATAANEVEDLKKELTEFAKKDSMTMDDMKDMEEKQKLLMDKMTEFEQITKLIQSLIGLAETRSSQLVLHPSTDGDQVVRPENNLPKVIVCGTGDIDMVPKIIICETPPVRSGQRPVFQELDTPHEDKPGPGNVVRPDFADTPGGRPRATIGFPGGGPFGGPEGCVSGSNYPGPGFPSLMGPTMFPYGFGLQGGQMFLRSPESLTASPGLHPSFPLPYLPDFSALEEPKPFPVPPCLEYMDKFKDNHKKKRKTEKQPTTYCYRETTGCYECCEHYEKKREKKKKRCFCQLAGFCPKN